MENVQQLRELEPSMVLMKPWPKNGGMYHAGGPSPNIMPFSLGSNLLLPPNHIPLRLIRWPHMSQYSRPNFPNPSMFNQLNYPMIQGMLPVYPPNHPMGSHVLPQQASTVPVNTSVELSPSPENNETPANFEQPEQQVVIQNICTNEIRDDPNSILLNDVPIIENKDAETEELLTELATGFTDNENEDINIARFCPTTTEEENTLTTTENMPCSLNDIAYEIEVETNTEQDLLQDVLSENNSEDNEDCEKISFNTIEEVLAAIDDTKHDEDRPLPFELSGENSRLNIKMGPGVQEEVVKAAKSLFSKRTRTLYHWLYPDTSKTKLKATVTSAWDTLPENEKHFYMSQVLGRFGLQAGNLMINPQLDGIKGLSTDSISTSDKSLNPAINTGEVLEADQAVDDLLASCAEADCWISYASQQKNNRKRKRKNSEGNQSLSSQIAGGMGNEHSLFSKRSKELGNCDIAFEEDTELNNELMKFQLFGDIDSVTSSNSDVWRQSPDTKELFDHLGF